MFDRVKEHVMQHKGVYLIGSYVVVAGITYYIMRGTIAQRGMGARIAQRGILNTASQFFITNIVNQEYGGKACRNLETGNIFLSQRKAASTFDISEGILSRHLQGIEPHVNGFHFERVNVIPG